MSPARLFQDDYREELRLPDGGTMRLRLVRPEDREGILEAFDQLSAETRVQRWFHPKTELSEQELGTLIEPADEEHGAIAAIELGPEDEEHAGIGIARFVRSPEDATAGEIAITIVDRWQRLGIGRILLHRLLAMMSERRIRFAEGRLHAENRRMRHLLEPYVPASHFRREDDLLVFRFPVPAADDPLMPQLARNAAAVVRMFKRMAEGAIVRPLELAEKHLESAGPKAQLDELRRKDGKED